MSTSQTVRVSILGIAALTLGLGYTASRATLTAAPQHAATAVPSGSSGGRSPAGVTSYSGVVDRVAPAVATVRVEKQAFRRERGLGSGVVFRQDGYILTNNHVIAGADRVSVDLADGRSLTANVVGADEASDLAVIHVNARDLPVLPFGDSGQVKVGDVVLAFGNPLGVGQTVTMGIVSAKGRTTDGGGEGYEDFLQTDAPINQGNSGGALVDTNGALVGINAEILSTSGGNIGLGFAIPSNMARTVADQLLKDGVVHRSKLGVTVQALTPDLAESLGAPNARGALVSTVEPGTPAERAGLKQGDLITAIDGQTVTDANALRNQIAGTRPDTSVTLTVWRGGKTEKLPATLVERENTAAPEAQPTTDEGQGTLGVGMAVTSLTPDLAAQLGLPRSGQGVVVTGIDPNGAAAAVGIQPGDVVQSVNGKSITSIQELRTALSAKTDKPTLLLLNRGGASLFLALPHGR